jgi:hypothetical protein
MCKHLLPAEFAPCRGPGVAHGPIVFQWGFSRVYSLCGVVTKQQDSVDFVLSHNCVPSFSLCTWKNTEKLEFKFILKAKPGNRANLIATEEGTNRVLHAGRMAAGEAGPDAQFKLLPLEEEEEEYTAPLLLTLLVSVEVDPVSPFALAASWQVVKKNIQSHGSTVLGIPDVCMGKLQHRRCASEAQISSSSPHYTLELDLQHYEVPTPTSDMSAVGIKYSANGAEDPSKSLLDQTSSGADMANFRDRSVSIKVCTSFSLFRI